MGLAEVAAVGVKVTNAPVNVCLAPDVGNLGEDAQGVLQVVQRWFVLASGLRETCQQGRGASRGHQVLGLVEDRLHLREQNSCCGSVTTSSQHGYQVRGSHRELPSIAGFRAQPARGLKVRGRSVEVVELVA